MARRARGGLGGVVAGAGSFAMSARKTSVLAVTMALNGASGPAIVCALRHGKRAVAQADIKSFGGEPPVRPAPAKQRHGGSRRCGSPPSPSGQLRPGVQRLFQWHTPSHIPHRGRAPNGQLLLCDGAFPRRCQLTVPIPLEREGASRSAWPWRFVFDCAEARSPRTTPDKGADQQI